MNTFDALGQYEDTLRRRSERTKRIRLVTLYVLGSAVFVFQAFRVANDFHFHPFARTPVVHVGGDGTLRVDGCSSNVTMCLARARRRGSSSCRIHADASAPELAKTAAMRECVAAQLDPSLTIVRD